jgi:hypothetical protein
VEGIVYAKLDKVHSLFSLFLTREIIEHFRQLLFLLPCVLFCDAGFSLSVSVCLFFLFFVGFSVAMNLGGGITKHKKSHKKAGGGGKQQEWGYINHTLF